MTHQLRGGADYTLGGTTTLVGGVAADMKEEVFKLFLVEAIGADEEPYSFSFTGREGATVCMKWGCVTNHNGERVNFEEGTLLIMKCPEVAFSDPTLDAILLSDGLLELSWKASWELFEVWRKKFTLAYSLDAMEVTEWLMKGSKDHFAQAA